MANPNRSLHQRASGIKLQINMEQEEQLALENQHKKKTPALARVLEGFITCHRFMQDESKRAEKYFKELNRLLTEKVVQAFTDYSDQEQRTVMGNFLARNDFVQTLINYYNFVMEEIDIMNEAVTIAVVYEAQQTNDSGFLLILSIREIMWNFSDSSSSFSELLADTNIFSRLVTDLEYIQEEDKQDMEEEGTGTFAFDSAVGILHNCARNPNIDKEKFREVKAVAHLLPFLQYSRVYVKMVTLLALGNMLKEDEVHILGTDKDVFDFVMDAISKAEKTKDRMVYGFHLSELMDGLASLAQSDKNKEKIMARDPLPLIKSLLKSHVTTETLAAVKFVWELAFLKENKDKILEDKALISSLKTLQSSPNKDIQKAARSAYFVIAEKDKRVRGMEADVSGKREGKHIMFSYSWGDKEMVYRIYKELKKEGYHIWIDFNEMNKYSNLLDGMAYAVENAFLILICYSEKYKNSQNCRIEAEYTFSLRRRIIPLKMQRNYTPDGWLGALIAGQLFIEFTPKYSYEMKVKELLNTIKDERGRIPEAGNKPPKDKRKQLKTWDKQDIDKWATEQELMNANFKRVREMNGELLNFMVTIQNKSPDTFYRWAEDKLALKRLEDLMRFHDAIETLRQFT